MAGRECVRVPAADAGGAAIHPRTNAPISPVTYGRDLWPALKISSGRLPSRSCSKTSAGWDLVGGQCCCQAASSVAAAATACQQPWVSGCLSDCSLPHMALPVTCAGGLVVLRRRAHVHRQGGLKLSHAAALHWCACRPIFR